MAVLSAAAAVGQSSAEMSLCDLVPERVFDKGYVLLRGRIAFTMHGTAFMRERCNSSPPGVAVMFRAVHELIAGILRAHIAGEG